MNASWNAAWPILRSYDEAHQHRVAMPLGGIGTGTVSLGGRGDLRDWEIVNRPAKGFVPFAEANPRSPCPAVVIWAKPAKGKAISRLLEGPLDPADFEGASGATAPNHGMPRFRRATFAVAYPLAQLRLQDPAMPVDVRLEAFNPLIPGDAERSGLPAAILRYVVRNPGSDKVTVAICASLPNFIGVDGSQTAPTWSGDRLPTGAAGNRNTYRSGQHVRGIHMTSDGVPPEAEAWGTMALTTIESRGLTHRTNWARRSWGDSLLEFWDDFSSDGKLHDCPPSGHAAVERPVGSVCVRFTIPPGESRDATFILAWHYPNRMTWTAKPAAKCDCAEGACAPPDNRIGNYYTSQFADAWEAAEYVAAHLAELEGETVRFVAAFANCDLPAPLKEAALFNLSTLRSQTCFRTPDGRFYGWEGCHDHGGCCLGSCTHVWNYEQATAFLFGDLARTMRDVEFAHSTDDKGLMSFRVHLPIERGNEMALAAADGQMGCLMKLYRDWQLSGDDDFLRRLWPGARRALEFCWIENGWDGDRDGVMEGCQHNTMDVEYYGPNPQMQGWYLGALRAGEAMASHLGEDDFADTCERLFRQGSAWMDEHLFNGDYYEHEIRPAASADAVPPFLKLSMGAGDPTAPALQLGSGCLIDQLVGQYMAHVCGLGYLHDRKHVRRTLRSILAYNRRESFYDHFNHLRSYVLQDESALLMASYPKGRRPERPFPYFNEVMTGFEYTVAAHLIYEGKTKQGLKVIEDIRDRYDGRKRNPFDEAECGHHYARAMASWASVLAATGFRYSAVTLTIAFKPFDGTWFWSNGTAWGTCRIKQGKKATKLRLTVLHGSLTLAIIDLDGRSTLHLDTPRTMTAIETVDFRL